MSFTIYLAGEVHSEWRQRIAEDVHSRDLDVELLSPVTIHEDSDACGEVILGEQPTPFWRDHTSAGINAIRTRTAMGSADLVVVRFGEKYRQWNAAFDAGIATAQGIPFLTLHPTELDHALKEVDAAAQAVCRTSEQVVDILEYVLSGRLAPQPSK
ncbi:MAG: YtoQ family protein [Phycisphaerales bacterium]|nr:YtoQ family protein [Phycisphaerales bacterium]